MRHGFEAEQGDEGGFFQTAPVPAGHHTSCRGLHFRISLSLRDVEKLLAERGLDLSYETVRTWALKFGRVFAANLRRRRDPPTGRWHLDEMVVKIRGVRMFLWRAVDNEGEVLDKLLQKGRNRAAAIKI